ncbi:MAG TPA: ABC transporter permease [Blastocatellia bacterium]|nr:ABC transporter permease [Blastocatellia bacterium]
MNTLWQDLRYGVRMMAKKPGLTFIAALSLALGIGANTSMFSVVNALFFRQLPAPEPDRLMFVFNGSRNSPWATVSYPNYIDYRDRNEVFSELAAYGRITVSLGVDDRPDQINGAIVTGNYFDMLGARAALGRAISPEDDRTPNAHPVIVISNRLWRNRFGGGSEVIGREVALNGHRFTVIGVMPAGFEGAEILEKLDVYTPMTMKAVARPPSGGFSGEMNPDLLSQRGRGWMRMIGRLKPGVSIEQAQAGMAVIARRLEQAYPSENQGIIATLFPVSKVDPRGYRPLVMAATLLMSVVGMVLLIACANVANLLLARASARRKEIAVRLAMGASRLRLIRQLMTESILLALLGGLAGLLIAFWAVDLLKATPPPVGVFSFNLDFGIDVRVLGFTLALSLLTGILFGLAPALGASRTDLLPSLKDESYQVVQSRRRFTMRNLLVIAQVALGLVLLIGAGLFLRSLWRIQDTHPGFDAQKVLTASLRINLLRYTKPQAREFYRRVIERVESVPGVQAASLARVVPISGDGRRGSFVLEGQGEQEINDRISRGEGLPSVRLNIISPKYFQTMGVALTRGRDFTAQDDEGAPSVVIVNDSFARQYFAGQDPLGKRLRFGEPRNPWSEIIGVVRDSKYRELSEDFGAIVYQALAQNHETGMTLHVRTAGDPLIVAGTLRREINSIEKNLPLTDMRPLTALIGSSLYPARMGAVLIGVFGSLALSLAAVGLYGVMSYAVSQRTREIGVRMALGAQTRDVLRLVLKEAMTLVVIGMVIGLGLAAALSRLIAGFLFGVGAMDLATFAAIPVLLAMVALLASYLPARRAMKIDPMVALRCD